METYTANATTQIELTHDQTVELLIKFLEKEFDHWTENLQRSVNEYAESNSQSYLLEDIKDSMKFLQAVEEVLSMYKEP